MRFLLSVLVLAAIAWSASLAWFITRITTEPLSPTVKAEALVVLTGGGARIEHGLDMLASGAAPVLLISGVGNRVTVADMLRHAGAETRQKIHDAGGEIILDHVARTTVSNAEQSTAFLRERGIRSIRLITANYHMRRSIHEFHDADPELVILPDPVFPDESHRDLWWEHGNTRRLLFSEFYKYLAVLLRDTVRPNN